MLELAGLGRHHAKSSVGKLGRFGGKRDLGVGIGCDDIGSAVAHSLHKAGMRVVLAESADPSWPHRGRTFTNAWYIGTAELEGEIACFCASVRSVPSILHQGLIAATTWSWMGLADVLDAAVIVDARMRVSRATPTLLGRARTTIAVGDQLVAGVDADLVLDATGGAGTDAEAARARSLDAARKDSPHVVLADAPGRFMTTHRIGHRVEAGEVVGHLGLRPVVAPRPGVLSGLSARGSRVALGQKIVEVDPRGDPSLCFGIEERSRLIAAGVLAAVTRSGPSH